MSTIAYSTTQMASVTADSETEAVPSHVRWCLIAMIATSSIVIFEPAPCDLAFVLSFPLLLLTGQFVVRRPINPVLYFGGGLFLLMNIISLAMAFELSVSLQYFAITFYLILHSLLIVSIVGRYGLPAFNIIKNSFLFAAMLTSVIGILARFQLIPNWEFFMLSEAGFRLRSTFKDSNVLGPYLVAAIALVLTNMMANKKIRLWELASLAIFGLGVILTLSRGAMVAGFVTVFVLVVLFWWVPNYRLATTKIVLRLAPVFVVVALIAVAILASTGVMDYFMTRWSYQSYDDERFLNHQHILKTVGRVPVGIGPGGWNRFNYLYLHDVHSLFLRTWVEHGTLGLIGLLTFLLAWCSDVWNRIARCGPYVHVYIVCGAIFWGIMSNSIIIDTIHWRHPFLFLAIPIGMIAYEYREQQPAEGETVLDSESGSISITD